MSKEETETVGEILREAAERGDLDGVVMPPEEAAASRLAAIASDEAIDRMIADSEEAGISLLDGPDGLIGQLTAKVIERALGAEMEDHLGYAKGDPAGNGSGNSRNGSYGKTVTTTAGPVRVQVPRDRNSTFGRRSSRKGSAVSGQVDEMILSLYARGMTTRDIQAHLPGVYGAEVSPALISKVTDVSAMRSRRWQTRPLDSFYAILYIDALMVKVRDGGSVDNKAAYLVTGVDIDGFKHVLGIWMAASEGSRFWGGVLAELRNRGIKDVLFVCCDGLNGLPEAIEAAWAPGEGPDLRRAPHPLIDEVRVLEGPQKGRRRDAARLHRGQRGGRESRPGGSAPRLGEEMPRPGRRMGKGLGPVRPVPAVRLRYQEGNLHDECDRVHQFPAAEDNQEPRPFPRR